MAMSQKTVLLTLVIVVVLATFLRVQDLSWETYSYSEVEMKQASDEYASGNFVNNYYIFDTPPLAKYIFGAAVMINDTESSMRIVSAVFGILTVLAVFLLSRKLYGENTALFASAITAFSIIHIQFSRYVQQETMLSFFYVMAAFFTWQAVHEKKKYSFAWLGIFLGLALATKFISIILFIFIIVYALYEKRIRLSIRRGFNLGIDNWILKSFVLAIIIFLAAWPFGFSRLHTDATISVQYGNEIRSQQISGDVPIILLSFSRRVFTSVFENVEYPILLKLPAINYLLLFLAKESILVLFLLALSVYCMAKKPTRQDKFIAMFAIVFLVLLSFQLTNITYRHITGAVPFLGILAARSASLLKRRQAMFIAVISLTLFVQALLAAPSYVLYHNQLWEPLGMLDTEAKASEGMTETIAYLRENCTSVYAGNYYRFMLESYYYQNFKRFNETADCAIDGSIEERFERGNIIEYASRNNCTVSATINKPVKILDIYKCAG